VLTPAPVDMLFLHVPRWRDGRREIMVMPTGFTALANLMIDEGRSCAISHLGIEREADPGFSLQALLASTRPRLVLLTLHWHGQTRGVIDTARLIRKAMPRSTIVVGGLTASAFARDLVSAISAIDGVVRGDGERPLQVLARVVLDGVGSARDVPNLVWRDGGTVVDNGLSWVLDEATAGGLRHGSLRALRLRERYMSRALYADFSEGADGSEGYPLAAYLNAGRGCAAECVHCGGASSAQMLTSCRRGVLHYPVAKLLRDVREAVQEGARALRMSFDPPAARRHLRAWFDAIVADGHRLRAIYDVWHLASPSFVDLFSRTFEPGSMLIFSPECGNEQLRYRIRGLPFTNTQLLRSLADAEDRGLRTHCFFSAGLPSETPAQVEETARLIGQIRGTTRSGISVCPMVLDPASPLHVHPERYGVRLIRKTLRDYYEERGLPGGPGYETEHFDEQGILQACNRLLAAAGLSSLAGSA